MVRTLILITFAIFMNACKSNSSPSAGRADGRISPTYSGPAETTFCDPASNGSISSPVTITGTAKYRRRNTWGDDSEGGLGSASLSGTHPATEHAIRYAEIRVTDSVGTVIRCGETGNDGTFSISLPQGSASYTLSVNSRSYKSSKLLASVLNQPEKNGFYSLQTSVVPNANKSVGTLVAAADGEVIGGAFNILDQMLAANDYIRSKVVGFTHAPKVVAYWEKGFNPNDYFGSSSGVSFYIPGYSRLFILGGVDGDVNSSDTDHFDDSVILHEYGHFLEDALFRSDSPGGPHNGNAIIDPRLAWSEGWGNFFQAAVLYSGASTPYYIDTSGNDDGTTQMFFHINLEAPPLTGSACYPSTSATFENANGDCPRETGEGHFREFSVARMLWDIVDTIDETRFSATENIDDQFDELWATLVDSTNGFNNTALSFLNVGNFHIGHSALYPASVTNMNSLRGVERHRATTLDYGNPLTASGSCSGFNFGITPKDSSSGVYGDTGSFATSDLFRNNDFYVFSATALGTLVLEYQDANGTGTVADLDLYIYKEDSTYGDKSEMYGYSEEAPSGGAAVTHSESVSSLPNGSTSLVNVKVYTGGTGGIGGAANYRLKFNGVQLCPTYEP